MVDYEPIDFIDFHTHSRRRTESNILEIVSHHPGKEKNKILYTIGHHPWWTDFPLDDASLSLLASAYREDFNCIGIGEFGLDNLKGAPMVVQESIVTQHLELADSIGSPVIIHCVRAYDQLLNIKKKFPNIDKWVIHGYARHAILAKSLVDNGFYLSIAPIENSIPSFVETIKNIPIDRVFLETDSHPSLTIEDVYTSFAYHRNISIAELKEQIKANVRGFFPKVDQVII